MSGGELESMLQALREETRGAQAPERVEAALRSAFRARARQVRQRRWQGWMLAAAAGVMLSAGAAAWWILSRPVVPPVVSVKAPAPVVLPPAVARDERPLPVRAARRVRRPRPVQPAGEVATEFLPLEETSGLAPMESGQVVRVELPRSTLARFGLPMDPDRMMQPVKADVVFAQDGIARAVRFVK